MAVPRPVRLTFYILMPFVVLALLWRWDWFIPLAEAQASAKLGRRVTIAHLHVAPGRITRVVADDVRIANPDGFAPDSQFAQIASLGVDVDLWAYLRGRPLAIPLIAVNQPVITVETAANGDANYLFHIATTDTPAPTLGELTITDGKAQVKLPGLKTDMAATIATKDQKIVIAVDGTYAGQKVTGSLVGDALLTLRDPADPYMIDLRLVNGSTQVSLVGSLLDPLEFAGADLKLNLSGPDMALLYPLTGIPLPKTPPYKISGQLDYADHKIRFRDFTGVVGNSDVAGTISVDPGKQRQEVFADLHSNKVDLEDLGGFIGSEPGRTDTKNMTPEQRQAVAKAEASPQLLPTKKLNLPRLRSADIHLKYRGAHIEGKSVPFDTIAVTADIVDGRITLHPISLGVGTGQIVGTVDLTPQADDMIVAKADVQFQKLDVARMMSATHVAGGAGRLGGQASIDTTGNSLSAMMGNGNGKLDLFMSGGNVSALLVDLSGLQFGNALLSALGIPDRATLECLIGRFTLKQGVLSTQTMLIDTSEAVVHGTGTIDLGHERLDYLIKTEAKHFSIGSLATPIGIAGSFKNPSIGPDLAKLGLRGGIAVGLGLVLPPLALLPTIQFGVGDDNRCAALLGGKK
jgi:uncharacterized protein involved in outer membrane biogenesis